MNGRKLVVGAIFAGFAISVSAQTVEHPQIAGADVAPPKLLHKAPARIPAKMDFKGEVLVLVVVDEMGHVAKAQVRSSTGRSDLDSEAIRAARGYEFVPSTKKGKPVAVTMMIAVDFQNTGS